jgi:SAM-dependent methyltransferase
MNQSDKRELAEAAYFDQSPLKAAQRYAASTEWKAILCFLPVQAGLALDVGAGNGIASHALAQAGWRVTAIEPDPSGLVGAGAILAIAADTGLPIEVKNNYGESIDVPDSSFDLVFARQVLHHAQSLPRLCDELYRVLRSGGRLITVRDHVISRKEDLQAFLDIHPLHNLYGGENAFLRQEYQACLTGAGFTIRKTLAPLLSPINYSPMTREGMRSELCRRLGKIPGAGSVGRLALRNDMALDAALRLVTWIDRRPGRLYSFVCDKPL